MIFDELVQEWENLGRPLPAELRTVRAERWWLWHDRARAMAHALYADQGWSVLIDGPVSADLPISGVAMIEAGVVREVSGDTDAVHGAQAGIAQAMTDLSTTLTAAVRTLPRPLQPIWSGPIPLPPEEQ